MALEYCRSLPGVGEALKREIVGLVLAEQPWLWGFDEADFFGSAWAGWALGACAVKLGIGFAAFSPICVTSRGFEQLSHRRYLDLRMPVEPHAV